MPSPLAAPPLRAAALFLAGVLVFADDGVLAGVGLVTTFALLLALGFAEGRWSALAWAGMVVVSAIAADVLWQLDWEPFNRSDDYEAIPQSPFVVLALPVLLAVVAVGVGARLLLRRRA